MRSVTRFITGQEDLPKQFCPMMDGMTWFENTRNRQPTPISPDFDPILKDFCIVRITDRALTSPFTALVLEAVRGTACGRLIS